MSYKNNKTPPENKMLWFFPQRQDSLPLVQVYLGLREFRDSELSLEVFVYA